MDNYKTYQLLSMQLWYNNNQTIISHDIKSSDFIGRFFRYTASKKLKQIEYRVGAPYIFSSDYRGKYKFNIAKFSIYDLE